MDRMTNLLQKRLFYRGARVLGFAIKKAIIKYDNYHFLYNVLPISLRGK